MKNKNLKIYDNGGKTFDRYTAVYLNQPEANHCFSARGMSENPTSPQGFGCWTTAQLGRHLGKLIKFNQLPSECQRLVLEDLEIEHDSSPNGCHDGCPACEVEND